jgi:hypothetical protein
MQQEEKFSEDPIEHVKIENEFLKIKLKAQYGEEFKMQGNADLPPEVENQFLKNMMAFEEAHANPIYTTVYEAIGKPGFKAEDELNDIEIKEALLKILDLMESHQISLGICDGPYEDRIIYTFITKELFGHEIEKISIEGFTCNFIYEEFHPNDKAEIEKNTHAFLKHWFTRDFGEYNTELADEFITADGKMVDQQALYDKLKPFLESFLQFKDEAYNIDEIKFQFDEAGRGLGHSEGKLKYDAIMENGEIIHYEGPYKLYMTREDKWWSIFYFVMPGFAW